MSDSRGPDYWSRNGYALCARCACLRPASAMADGHCTDVAWCSRQAGHSGGKAGLDSNGDAESVKPDEKPPDAP